MTWNQQFPSSIQPRMEQISAYVASPYWDSLCSAMAQRYQSQPLLQYSCCSLAPGWNVKFRRGSKALCTLYPDEGVFTCMVSVGQKEDHEAQLLLPSLTPYVQQLYRETSPFNGGRWLSVVVGSPEILEDALALIDLRVPPSRRWQVQQ